MSKSLRPPVASFTSAKRRRFTVGPGKHDERFPGDSLWNDTWPILLGGKQVGSISRNLSYGTGATGEPRWQGSLSALRWAGAMDAPVGLGYDVAAFDTARECLAAWGRSADQLLDWAKSEGRTIGKGGPAPRRGSVRRAARRPAEKAERKAPAPAEPGYTIGDARYAKGQKLVKCPSANGLKSRAGRLVGDGLKGRYTNREHGYIVSPTKAARFEDLYAQGWDASAITGELQPPEGHAADVAPAKAARPRRAAKASRKVRVPAPATRPRRSRIPAAAIEKAREESPGKYPLPIAEQKLAGLYDYVKREGGKLPPCGK